MGPPKQSAPRRILPFALFAALLAVTLATLPERTYGDDGFLVWCIVRGRAFTAHFLFMPLARAWTWAFAHAGVDPFLALRVLAAVGTAAGVALVAAAALRRGLRAGYALGLALLVATASSTTFFARAAEIHGVQLAAVGLLLFVAAGLRADSRPARTLGLAVAFGLAVGAHKTSALLLPAVLLAYALATRGRPRRLRLRDAAWFGAGGAASLGAMFVAVRLQSGVWATSQESAGYWTGNFAAVAHRLTPGELARYAAEAWIAPAFGVAVLGALALGGLLRARPARGLALALALLPHAVVLPLFGWAERGAYVIVLLPVLLAALAAPLAELPRLDGRALRRANRALVAACVVAGAGAVLPESLLLERLGTAGLVAPVALAFALGLVGAPRLRPGPPAPIERRFEVVGAALLLAAAQLVGSARELVAWSRATPLLDWGRDVVAVCGDEDVLVYTGFEEHCLLLLINRPWGPPYAGTWDYLEELDTLGPKPFDVGAIAPKLVEGVERYLAEGRRVFVLKRVFERFEDDPLRGPHVRAVAERFELVPVERGAFRAFEVLERGA